MARLGGYRGTGGASRGPGCSPSGACRAWALPGLGVDRGLLDLTAPGGGRDAHPTPGAWALARSPSEPCDGGGRGPETPGLLDQPSQLSDQGLLDLTAPGVAGMLTLHRARGRSQEAPVSLVTVVDMGLRPWGSWTSLPSSLTRLLCLSF